MLSVDLYIGGTALYRTSDQQDKGGYLSKPLYPFPLPKAHLPFRTDQAGKWLMSDEKQASSADLVPTFHVHSSTNLSCLNVWDRITDIAAFRGGGQTTHDLQKESRGG